MRIKEQLFLVEGDKIVQEVINSTIRIKELFATDVFLSANESRLPTSRSNGEKAAINVTTVTREEIKKASLQKQPQNSLAICVLPSPEKLPEKMGGISLYLDGIQDPGNLGTIIRTCDWFGVEFLFCSPDTADLFNPKVIQASMGSFCRVKTAYTSFDKLAELARESQIPVYGTFLEGQNLFTEKLPSQALIVLGNEGRGIRQPVAEKTVFKISIPSFGAGNKQAESLNVAVAAGIICSRFIR